MTREQQFEQRLADWLAEGPLAAPERVIDAAVAHAHAHPRRRRSLGGLRKTVVERKHLAPVVSPAHRTRITTFAAVAVAVAVGLAVVGGGALMLSRGPGNPPVVPGSSPTSSALTSAPSASPARTVTAAPETARPSGDQGLVHVTSAVYAGTDYGYACGGSFWCRFDATIEASDHRLSGCYVLQPTGATTAGTWGTVAFYQGTSCAWDLPTADKMTWDGEWFTAGSRPVQSGTDPSAIYPVDTVWLHGRGDNEGLSAVLRLWGDGSGGAFVLHMEGWTFPTQPQP